LLGRILPERLGTRPPTPGPSAPGFGHPPSGPPDSRMTPGRIRHPPEQPAEDDLGDVQTPLVNQTHNRGGRSGLSLRPSALPAGFLRARSTVGVLAFAFRAARDGWWSEFVGASLIELRRPVSHVQLATRCGPLCEGRVSGLTERPPVYRPPRAYFGNGRVIRLAPRRASAEHGRVPRETTRLHVRPGLRPRHRRARARRGRPSRTSRGTSQGNQQPVGRLRRRPSAHQARLTPLAGAGRALPRRLRPAPGGCGVGPGAFKLAGSHAPTLTAAAAKHTSCRLSSAIALHLALATTPEPLGPLQTGRPPPRRARPPRPQAATQRPEDPAAGRFHVSGFQGCSVSGRAVDVLHREPGGALAWR